jgi:hyperosmotically inducible periplasmic protein
MKKHIILGAIAALSVACGQIALADDNATESRDSHHFVKDSVITTKVKAKLAEKHMSTLTNIRVDTDANGVVWLSGHAPTKDARDLAGELAKNTEGVEAVHNDVTVQPHSD